MFDCSMERKGVLKNVMSEQIGDSIKLTFSGTTEATAGMETANSVKEVRIHPDYWESKENSDNRNSYDIALVQMEKVSELNKYVE